MLNIATFAFLLLYIREFVVFTFPDSPIFSYVAWMLLYTLLILPLHMVISLYLTYARPCLNFLGRSILSVLVGVFVILSLSIYDIRILTESKMSGAWAASYVILFSVGNRKIAEFFSSRFPLHEHEIRRLAKRFPPQRFSDLSEFSVYLIVILIVLPILASLRL